MTYGNPHTVRGWDPTDIVTTVDIPPADQVGSYTGVVRATVPGPVILIPTVALTPVDTTPAEPEPGAWDINGVLCVRDPSNVAQRWFWCIPAEGRSAWTTWKLLWSKHGGPGITPRRLMPEPNLPEVTLPWHAYDGDGSLATVSVAGDRIHIAVTENPRGSGDEAAVVEYRGDTATRMAAALLLAAREVKP